MERGSRLHYDAKAIAFKMFIRVREHFGDEKNELLDLQFVIYYNPKTSKTTPKPNRTEDVQVKCWQVREKQKEYTKKENGDLEEKISDNKTFFVGK